MPALNQPGTSNGISYNRVTKVKAKNFKETMVRLWRLIGNERRLLVCSFILVFIDSSIMLLVPYLIGRAIDAMNNGNRVNFSILGGILLAMLVAYAIDTIVTIVQGITVVGISQRIVLNLRKILFRKLQKLPISFFDAHTHGEIMSRFINDIDNVSSTLSQVITQLMSTIVTITGSLILMFVLSPLLAVVSLITVPMAFLVAKVIASKTRVYFREQQAILGTLNGNIEENVSGLLIIKAFNHEEKTIEEFRKVNSRLCDIGIKAQTWSGNLMPLMNVVNNLGFTLVAGVGSILAVKGMITIGIIASFLSYSSQFAKPLNDLANTFNTLQSAIAGVERVFEVLDQEEELSDVKCAKMLENTLGNIEFENVDFEYRKDVPILKNINFKAKSGSTTALVGPTGAGKTTIVNLLTRFYDVSSGKIMIDGIDIKEYTRNSVRKSFGIVLQDTYLFSGTIEENIKYGSTSATYEEVKRAAKIANADTFINRLPKGYNTLLSESGSNLSEGERQLLAIARVILLNPSILILDEATSSVDTLTELSIQSAMLNLMKGRTSFIIAHRLSTIRDADTIMVIDGGETVESGSHESLLRNKGPYYNLYYSQFKNLVS